MRKSKTREILSVMIIGAILALLVDYFLKPHVTHNVKSYMRVPH